MSLRPTDTLYKVLDHNRQPCHGGARRWPEPGKWRSVRGALEPCANGLHLCREQDLVQWLGPEIWTAEYDGERVEAGNKIVVRRARLISRVETWTERTARLFAADCAERVLPIYEASYPDDTRPREAIAAARAYARGEIDAAARDAARDAAGDAARDAAGDAARDAAWAAARDAAGDVARDAAWAAAWDAERKWQTARLMQYLRGEVS